MPIVPQPDCAGHPASTAVAKVGGRPDASIPRCVLAVVSTLAQSRLRRARYVFLALCVGAVWLALGGRAQAAGLAVDASVATHQGSPSSGITSGTIATSAANELLVAFISSDGPAQGGSQGFSSVTGGGLTWKLRERTNTQAGTAEIWEAAAPNPFTNVAVTATRSSGAYEGSIKLVAFNGADTGLSGAVGGASAASGAPSVSLTATRTGSWVWGVGTDWDRALARTVGNGQTLSDQYLAPAGDTYWVQSQSSAGNTAGSSASLTDTSPTGDRWDFAAVEILPTIPDTTPPTPPTNLQTTAVTSNQVSLSWTASTSAVGIASYQVLRDGGPVGTSTGTSFSDATVSPSTTYNYTVEAVDTQGLVSAPSNPLMVTTPAASTNPPVISNVASSGVTDTSATITWTTDISSSSQMIYGPTSSYGQSTTLDGTQVTRHSQTLTNLTPSTQYHFAVQSKGSASNTSTSGDNTFTTKASSVTLPDMQIKVPTNNISIGTNPSSGHRQLQFTHITWDGGTGPFEIDPTYSAATGTSSFTQAIYKSTTPGVWTLDHRVPVAATGAWNPATGSDYNFPLTKFTLRNVNPDGSAGTAVATSPKTDYCITGDTFVGGVPNTPNQTFIPQSNCSNPNDPLGWSVGWGDEYDQTDAGQPIDLSGIPDGQYLLAATVDPQHVLTESNATNDTVDTLLQISGKSVTVISQTNPGTTPPTVSLTAPASGASLSGTVTLQASAAATAPATVSAVQFLLDGQPLGSPVTSTPYTFNWTVGSTSLGSHTLSARATDSNGNVATAPGTTVNVVSGGPPPPPNNPTVSITNPVPGEVVSGSVPVAATVTSNLPIASVQFVLDGVPLGSAVTSSPYSTNWDTTPATAGTHTLSARATDTAGDVGTSSNVAVTVQNPAPPMTCFVMQADVNVHGSTTVTTPSFHTAAAGEVLVAFVSADGPTGSGQQHATVSGAGLTWTLVKRSNSQPGDAEVWQATAPSVLSGATVTSTASAKGFGQSLTVIGMEGVSGIGASVAGSAGSGAPNVSLTTTSPTSLVFAVGHDWDNAIARTLPSGWVLLDQWLNTAAGDTFWSQYTNTPTGPAGSVVTVNDAAPTNDQWNMVAVELKNDDG
jgi:hypothetical protein